MDCFRCDGKGEYKNQFGIMEKCESCQKMSMSFEKVDAEADLDEEGYWEIFNRMTLHILLRFYNWALSLSLNCKYFEHFHGTKSTRMSSL